MSIEVDYRFESGDQALKYAKVIAVGQTAGSWNDRFTHRESALKEHLGEVVAIETLDDGRGLATIAFPESNVEGDIGTLLTMIFGKFSMAVTAKVTEIRLPDGYGTKAKYGSRGIRQLLDVNDRPLIMAIFKPALGLSSSDHAEILEEVGTAGLDIIKDDEILGDLSGAPTLARQSDCKVVLDRLEQDRGHRMLYAVNLTGRSDQIHERARELVGAGANALLFNVLSHGFSVLEGLAADPDIDVPIFAHPALAGALCAAPDHGFSYGAVLGTLMAHAGADAVLFPAHYGSLPFDVREEKRIRQALRARGVFPVPSAGIHPGVVPQLFEDYGTEVIMNAGTGIMDHPDGPAAGVRAFFEALQVFEEGGEFDPEKVPEGALKRALERWSTL